MFPTYSIPGQVSWGLAASVLFRRRRSFRLDGLACIRRLEPALQVAGRENIPLSGPCLITFNHYYRPGFDAWWMALAIAAVTPQELHFVMTGELTYPGKWYAPAGMIVSRWLLKRIGRAYGFTTMPPMPPRPKDTAARASSVRMTLAFVESHPQAMVALAPEGGDQPGGVLAWPPAGTGRFIHLLTRSGMPILPVGVFEEAGKLCLSFGEAYHPSIPNHLANHEKDRWMAGLTMRAIAGQVPARLRGEFDRPAA
jgi:hypothetical protein